MSFSFVFNKDPLCIYNYVIDDDGLDKVFM